MEKNTAGKALNLNPKPAKGKFYAVQGAALGCLCMWLFPKIRGTFLGVPTIRTKVFWGLRWGPSIYGNYHVYIIQFRIEFLCRLLAKP